MVVDFWMDGNQPEQIVEGKHHPVNNGRGVRDLFY